MAGVETEKKISSLLSPGVKRIFNIAMVALAGTGIAYNINENYINPPSLSLTCPEPF